MSYLLFQLLGTQPTFLQENPDSWNDNDDYVKVEQFVRTVKVCNDTAERGCSLITDYATLLTMKDHERQHLLQGVE